MKTTFYNISAKIESPVIIAHLSDLHGDLRKKTIDEVKKAKPDIIAITGDLGEWDYVSSDKSLAFLRELVQIAPTFYSLGNHENGLSDTARQRVRSTGVRLLDDCFEKLGEVTLGGLTSGFFHANIGNGSNNPHIFRTPPPNTDFLDKYEREDGYKILLCHHPEYYFDYIKERDIDLVLTGHAHGGQIRLFGRGVIAPGQGFFPKYTSGIHDGRLVISRGMTNTSKLVPRLFNGTELVIINIGSKENY